MQLGACRRGGAVASIFVAPEIARYRPERYLNEGEGERRLSHLLTGHDAFPGERKLQTMVTKYACQLPVRLGFATIS